jgi:hypothetical protein
MADPPENVHFSAHLLSLGEKKKKKKKEVIMGSTLRVQKQV